MNFCILVEEMGLSLNGKLRAGSQDNSKYLTLNSNSWPFLRQVWLYQVLRCRKQSGRISSIKLCFCRSKILKIDLLYRIPLLFRIVNMSWLVFIRFLAIKCPMCCYRGLKMAQFIIKVNIIFINFIFINFY